MECTYELLDVDVSATHPLSLQKIVVKQAHEVWYIATSPILPDRTVKWVLQRKSSHVCIPLVPYLLQQDPALAVGFGVQLGCHATSSLQRQTDSEIRRIHIVIGYPAVPQASDRFDKACRVYCGVGSVVELTPR